MRPPPRKLRIALLLMLLIVGCSREERPPAKSDGIDVDQDAARAAIRRAVDEQPPLEVFLAARLLFLAGTPSEGHGVLEPGHWLFVKRGWFDERHEGGNWVYSLTDAGSRVAALRQVDGGWRIPVARRRLLRLGAVTPADDPALIQIGIAWKWEQVGPLAGCYGLSRAAGFQTANDDDHLGGTALFRKGDWSKPVSITFVAAADENDAANDSVGEAPPCTQPYFGN